ncbi:MAG TPA: diacylglycerol kinase family protein [Candidatus Acidoferrales bacterium]|jgi:diacylglycerol kinase (ATP)|nr:diacylglycerol kinase family protein [Candidatus Acidoferrales bacterium]
MRICVIFNPAARGNKARRFRRFLNELSQQCALKATTGPGDARRLAQAAVATGYDIIAAAGGDGTVNEVLNGIGDEPDGFQRARLGVLPLGTVNVFARELKIPAKLESAWQVLKRAKETRIDLGRVDFSDEGKPAQCYFMQLAGAGLDARAIELVSWKLKKSAGPLAYVVAGFQALAEKQVRVSVSADGKKIEGELALLGNGRLYGGPFDIFPGATLDDGLLDACVFPSVNLPALFKLAPGLLFRKKLPEHRVLRLRSRKMELTSETPASFELDGEWIGYLPATFSLEQKKLRVVIP